MCIYGARLEVNLANKLPMIIILFAEGKKSALFATNMKTAERGQLRFIMRINFFTLNMHETLNFIKICHFK
jgi:hypothetical protein